MNGLFYSQQGIKGRCLGIEKLSTATGIPMYAIVNLLEADTAISGGSEGRKIIGVRKSIVLSFPAVRTILPKRIMAYFETHHPLLICPIGQILIRCCRITIWSWTSVSLCTILRINLAVISIHYCLWEFETGQRVSHFCFLKYIPTRHIDSHGRWYRRLRDSRVARPVPKRCSQGVRCLLILSPITLRVSVRNMLCRGHEPLLV